MTWTQFKTYLETKILQTDEENENTYLLHPSAKKKYSPPSEKELITVLTNLLQSIDNLPSYSSLSENEEYHSLPDLSELYPEPGKLITWTQLFPNRTQTHFGKKEEIESEISAATWKTLTQIFSDFTLHLTRSKRLQSALGEQELMGFLLEAAINLNYDLIKRKGYDKYLKMWVQEYNLLEKTEQAQLSKQKDMIDKLLEALEEEEKTREQKSWLPNWPWKKMAWYGGGGLLVILVVGWLWRKLQE